MCIVLESSKRLEWCREMPPRIKHIRFDDVYGTPDRRCKEKVASRLGTLLQVQTDGAFCL